MKVPPVPTSLASVACSSRNPQAESQPPLQPVPLEDLSSNVAGKQRERKRKEWANDARQELHDLRL